MPYIRISVAGPTLATGQIAALQRQTTELMTGILGKHRELTVVAVEGNAAGTWSAGGEPLQEGRRCAQVDAFITAGSNRPEEKAAFLEAAYVMLVETLGAADPPVYVVIHEIPAGDWGYDGKSQAARRSPPV